MDDYRTGGPRPPALPPLLHARKVERYLETMIQTKPKKDFLFLDEAGDPGWGDGSSDAYVSFCLHVSDQSYPDAAEVVTEFRWWSAKTSEIKGKHYDLDNDKTRRFFSALSRLSEEFQVNATAIYLRKAEFTGPYLRPNSWAGSDPLKFRNWVFRQLLETHYRFNPKFSDALEIVFDRYELAAEDRENLEQYLQNNWNLPNVAFFTHADGLYVDFLQVTDLLQEPFLRIARGTASDDLKKAISFVNAWDYTDRDNPTQTKLDPDS